MLFTLGTTPTVQRSMFFARLVLDDVNRAAETYEYASGKSINVARVAHTLGEDGVTTGFLGGDRGAFVRAELDREGIRHDFVEVAARTRLCTTVVDRAAGTVTELVEEAGPAEASAWADLFDRVDAGGRDAPVWVLSGSLPPGAPQDFYARCLERAATAGARAVLDARGEPLRQALRRPGFVAKMNRDELAATVGRPVPDADAVAEAIRQVVPERGAAVITMGSEGAICTEGRDLFRVRSPRVKAVSAVGSGDAFSAGLAIGLLRGCSLAESAVLAAACGAANAMTALAGQVVAQEVERLVGLVTVEDL